MPSADRFSPQCRAWFLRAYFADRSGQSKDVAMQYYNAIVDVLEWGLQEWKDVPNADRGYVFQKTFVRAVKRIRMAAYLNVRPSGASDLGCALGLWADGLSGLRLSGNLRTTPSTA